MTMPPLFAIVPAAGIGARMGADKPKQYLQLLDRSVIEHTLSKLLNISAVEKVIVCLAADDASFQKLPCAQSDRVVTVEGGATRGDSVRNGLKWLHAQSINDAWALVHDAARPCVKPNRIESLIAQCTAKAIGGILAVPMANTLRYVNPCAIGHTKTVCRDNIWAAHTPQLFPAQVLWEGLESAAAGDIEITDEASAVEAIGGKVLMIEDDTTNIKITRPEDLPLAALILEAQSQEIL